MSRFVSHIRVCAVFLLAAFGFQHAARSSSPDPVQKTVSSSHQANTESDHRSEPKSEHPSKALSDHKPDPKAELHPIAHSDHRPMPETAHRPESKSDHERKSQSDHKRTPPSEHRPVPKSEHKPKPESDHKPRPKAKPKATSDHPPKRQSDHQPRPQSKEKPKPQSDRKPSPRSDDKSKPDLTVDEVEITSIDNGYVEYTYRITNLGKSPAKLSGVVATGAFSADKRFDSADIPSGSHKLSGVLAPGSSIHCSCVGLIKDESLEFLVVNVDTGNALDELNEDNNSNHAEHARARHKEPKPETTIIDRADSTSKFLVKAAPPPTLIFEAPHPPTFVFLPQAATGPRIIRMQPQPRPQLYVIDGGGHSRLPIPRSLLEYKPPCICIELPGHAGPAKPAKPSGDPKRR